MTPDGIEEFESVRPRLFAIAYRMLGRVSDAEDVVQETFLRFQRALRKGTEIESTPAFLSSIVTRLSINELQSARARREVYVGEWLPEPLFTDADGRPDDPAAHAEEADSLSLAFLTDWPTSFWITALGTSAYLVSGIAQRSMARRPVAPSAAANDAP